MLYSLWINPKDHLNPKVPNFLVNPLSPNSDQDQFSPNDIHTLSRDKVMRITEMITKEKMLWSFIEFLFKEMYRDQFGEQVCGYWGLKG